MSNLHLPDLTGDALRLIAACCSQHDLSMLSSTSRKCYDIFQPLLWKHPKLSTLPMLINFINYVRRPHQKFQNVSDEATYQRACEARVNLVETIHIRIPATSFEMDGVGDCLKDLIKTCPKARISLLLQKNTTTNYKPLTELFPGVLFFMFTSAKERKKNVAEFLYIHKVLPLSFREEQNARDSLKGVFCRDLSDNPHLMSKDRAAVGDIRSIDIEVAVERNISFKPGNAWPSGPLRPVNHIFWCKSADMNRKLDQLNRLPGPFIRECMGAWTAKQLESDTPEKTFWA